MLIVVAGLPGAGKSTLATDLGQALNCAVLGVDQAEAAMWRAGVSPSGPTHHAAYLVVGALAARLGTELKFIVVECGDDDIYRGRLEHRTRSIEGYPEPTWEGVLRRRAEFPPWTDERLTVDSVDSRAANLRAAREYLRV
ncbi:MAG TPA: AAA family ATPase [Streptosporangiaceae bacterium]|jgi:predicted kinase